MAQFITGGISAAKQDFIKLREDSTKHILNSKEREEILGRLKVLGRDANNVRALYDKKGVQLLGLFAFGEYTNVTKQEAQRCLANALLLLPETQQMFVDLDLAPKTADTLQNLNDEDEFLASRILFLLTYNKSTDFDNLIANHNLAENVITQISRHAEEDPESSRRSELRSMTINALSESLKLLVNVVIANPSYTEKFSAAVRDLLKIFLVTEVPNPPLQPPLTYVLNALANFEFSQIYDTDEGVIDASTDSLFIQAIEKLMQVLDTSTRIYKPAQLETQLIPLVTILRQINEKADVELRDKMREQLLPSDSERDRPLGQSTTLPSRLLQLITSPGLIQLPEALASLLFELSDKDAATFIKNIGYGYAAGYLMTHQIPIPEDIKQGQSVIGQVPINPVTGQRLDKEPNVDMPEMTKEEKEREAERLFVLFERLKATGIADIKNPVQQAREEGRFEELSDSESG